MLILILVPVALGCESAAPSIEAVDRGCPSQKWMAEEGIGCRQLVAHGGQKGLTGVFRE